jgi:polyisoprenoid-binding protein YceI
MLATWRSKRGIVNVRDVKSLGSKTLATFACGFLLLAAARESYPQTPEAPAGEIMLTIDPGQSKVHWTVDSTLHVVHGTFTLTSGSLSVDPETGRARGEIVVYADSSESGNRSRDTRMHKEILETAKYPDVIFRLTQFDGKLALSGISDGNIHGILSIHGEDHQLTTSVHAELTGDRWNGTTKFEVPYVNWGIKDPSNFLLKVKPVANVEIELSGEVKPSR